MFVLIAQFDIHILAEPNSLKGKRRYIKSIVEKLKNKLHASAAEVGKQDLWQRAEIGISYVSSNYNQCETVFTRAVQLIESGGELEVVRSDYEVEKYSILR